MNARILLIEDDPSTGAALESVLTAEGYAVELVVRGNDGLARAKSAFYDLVLTDFKLPGLDGLELIRQLHERKPKLPVILMTAHGTTETAIEATKLGACEYLPKPFEADELLECVAVAVRSSRLMSEAIEMGMAPEAAARWWAAAGRCNSSTRRLVASLKHRSPCSFAARRERGRNWWRGRFTSTVIAWGDHSSR